MDNSHICPVGARYEWRYGVIDVVTYFGGFVDDEYIGGPAEAGMERMDGDNAAYVG